MPVSNLKKNLVENVLLIIFIFLVVFTQNQLNTILNVLSLSAYNDVVAIQGILNVISSAESMVYDPSFNYTEDTLGMHCVCLFLFFL